MTRVAGAVLAAGAGVRMGGPKAELDLGGQRLVDRAVRVLRDGGCEPVIAVVRPATEVAGARVVVNPDPERGMRSSLELAVGAGEAVGAAALAVLLVDLPGIGAAAVRAVVDAWRPGRVAVAGFAGARGHPIVMGVDDWRAALLLAGPDEGARAYLRTRPELVDRVAAHGDPADLDTLADLRRWLGEAAE